MKKTSVALVLAPLVALGLAACGGGGGVPGVPGVGGSTPAATPSAPGIAAPSVPAPSDPALPTASTGQDTPSVPASPGLPTEQPSAPGSSNAPGSATGLPDKLPGATPSEAAEYFASQHSGFRTLPSATVLAQLKQAASGLAGIAVEPAACKDLVLKSIDILPEDVEMGLAMKAEGSGATTVTYYAHAGDYFAQTSNLVHTMSRDCSAMKQTVEGKHVTVKIELWDASRVQGQHVYGSVEATQMGSNVVYQTKVFAEREGTGILAQTVSNRTGAAERAEVMQLLEDAFSAL